MNRLSVSASAARRALLSPGVKRALLWGGLVGAIAAAIRFGVIELDFFRARCEAPLPLWCWPRQVLALAADRWMYGAVSLALGIYVLLKPARTGIALAAVILGAIGLALYNAGPASVGLVFGLVTLARSRS
jgi:hypothetical protein